jgi:hypothetical protein
MQCLQHAEQQLLPLLGQYDISHDNPNRWLVLALVLAAESGKVNARPAHAPTKWDAFADLQLCERVLAAKAQIAEIRDARSTAFLTSKPAGEFGVIIPNGTRQKGAGRRTHQRYRKTSGRPKDV